MLPVGTEVYYKGHFGVVKFSCEDSMSICVRVFPDEPSRNVCLVVYKWDFDEVELTTGNQAQRD